MGGRPDARSDCGRFSPDPVGGQRSRMVRLGAAPRRHRLHRPALERCARRRTAAPGRRGALHPRGGVADGGAALGAPGLSRGRGLDGAHRALGCRAGQLAAGRGMGHPAPRPQSLGPRPRAGRRLSPRGAASGWHPTGRRTRGHRPPGPVRPVSVRAPKGPHPPGGCGSMQGARPVRPMVDVARAVGPRRWRCGLGTGGAARGGAAAAAAGVAGAARGR